MLIRPLLRDPAHRSAHQHRSPQPRVSEHPTAQRNRKPLASRHCSPPSWLT